MLSPFSALLLGPALVGPAAPAAADSCPDVEVVFARGTSEPPGVGRIGQSFVDTLRSRLAAKSVGVYPVNYPATTDFPTAADGISDAGAHVQQMAANCPGPRWCWAATPRAPR